MTSPSFVRVCAALALVVSVGTVVPSAHKTVVSPYTFHRDVLPILQSRCAACHADGGVASPLATYAQVKALQWQIQQALISGRMPVWYADPQAAAFKGSRALSAKELNILMTWAAAGAPEGRPLAMPRPPRRVTAAPPQPSTTLAMPDAFTLAADQQAQDRETVWPAGALAGKWLAAADVVPGAPSIVHHASVAIRSPTGEQVVSLWVPGDTPPRLPGGGAFKVPADASIVLRIHYQRPSDATEVATAVADCSRIRLQLAPPAAARAVGQMAIEGAGDWPYNTTHVFTRTVDSPVSIAAIRPIGGPTDSRVSLTVIGADGRRMPLARVVLRPEWPRRYVFATPITVAAGSQIEAAVTASFGVAFATLTDDRPVGPTEGGPFRLVIETLR